MKETKDHREPTGAIEGGDQKHKQLYAKPAKEKRIESQIVTPTRLQVMEKLWGEVRATQEIMRDIFRKGRRCVKRVRVACTTLTI